MPYGDTTRHVNGDRGVEMYKAAVHFQRGKNAYRWVRTFVGSVLACVGCLGPTIVGAQPLTDAADEK